MEKLQTFFHHSFNHSLQQFRGGLPNMFTRVERITLSCYHSYTISITIYAVMKPWGWVLLIIKIKRRDGRPVCC
jgi:hypothetical protein